MKIEWKQHFAVTPSPFRGKWKLELHENIIDKKKTCLVQVKTVIGGLTGADSVVCSRSVVVKPDMSLEDAVKQV